MSPATRLATWLYQRPRLQRAWKVSCALWFGTAWALVAAPSAAAQPYTPTAPSILGGQFLMAWTGLHDSHGVPVADYFVSTVSPLQAGVYAAEQQRCGLTNPVGCLGAGISGLAAAISNILGRGFLATECSILLFIGAAGIWLVKFALSAPWLPWLATLAAPVVNDLNVMIRHLYVIPIALLVCTGIGGIIALTKGWGRGLGIIGGGFFVILLIASLFRDPVQDLIGPNGVLGMGQYLGFMVAEGAVHNGPLAPGGNAASLDTLTSLLCDVLLREPIQLVNFNMVVDDIPACANAWSAAIMTGQISAPANAMASCGDPAALAYADQLGLWDAGIFLVVILVEIVVMLALVYIAFHIILIGFKAFGNMLVLVVAAPLAVAPGPPRRYARHKVGRLVIDGVEMFATIVSLAIVVIIQGQVASGAIPGLTSMSTFAKMMIMLLLAVAGALGYRHMVVQFRNGPGMGHRVGDWLTRSMEVEEALAWQTVNWFGNSIPGQMRRRHMLRHGIDEIAEGHHLEFHDGGHGHHHGGHGGEPEEEPPRRQPPQPPADGPDGHHGGPHGHHVPGGGGSPGRAGPGGGSPGHHDAPSRPSATGAAVGAAPRTIAGGVVDAVGHVRGHQPSSDPPDQDGPPSGGDGRPGHRDAPSRPSAAGAAVGAAPRMIAGGAVDAVGHVRGHQPSSDPPDQDGPPSGGDAGSEQLSAGPGQSSEDSGPSPSRGR